MSHQLVAVAWDQLKGRHDIAEILQEAIGKHAVDLSTCQLHDDVAGSIDSLMRVVSWIKLLFDLQRAFVLGRRRGRSSMYDSTSEEPQGAFPYTSSASPLSSELIFSTMMYLIHLKSRLFPISSFAVRDYSTYRFQIAQVLLSGMRILLLRGEVISAERRHNLKRSLKLAWGDPDLPEDERFVVTELLPAAIHALQSAEHVFDRRPNFEKIPLNSEVFVGLHSLNEAPEGFVPQCLDGLGREWPDRIGSYWQLFDTLWAGEVELVRCFAETDNEFEFFVAQAGRNSGIIRQRPVFAEVETTRKALFRAVFDISGQRHVEGFSPDSAIPKGLIESLTATTFSWAGGSNEERKYGRRLMQTRPLFESAMSSFIQWIHNRRYRFWDSNGESKIFHSQVLHCISGWMRNVATPTAEDYEQESRGVEQSSGPIYVVDCPSLHPVSKSALADVLRWSGKTSSLEELRENRPILSVESFCPRCAGDVSITVARLIEPLEDISGALLNRSADAADDWNRSHSASSRRPSQRAQMTFLAPDIAVQGPNPARTRSVDRSRFSPTPDSESQSRTLRAAFSAVVTGHSTSTPADALADPRGQTTSSPTASRRPSLFKAALGTSKEDIRKRRDSRPHLSISRRTASFRERPSKASSNTSLPRNPNFSFSTSGSSLLFWGDDIHSVMRFEYLPGGNTITQSLRYDLTGVLAAAGGDDRFAIFASQGFSGCKLFTYYGQKSEAETVTDIDVSLRTICMAMSRNDKYIGLAINDEVRVYQVNSERVRRVTLQDQMHGAYQSPSQHKATTNARTEFLAKKQHLSWKEVEQESQHQNSVQDRKIVFSSSDEEMLVATHLADNSIHLDVWDCRAEPWTTKPYFSRTFHFPPWTTNDGDIASVFYDSSRQAAFFSAFLGKEYPLHIPIPGYDDLIPDQFSTRIFTAAQSPSGSRFVAANGVNELLLFGRRSQDNALNPRRLKKSACKGISSGAFKPGHMIVAMPANNAVVAFWVKDGRMTLRSIAIDDEEGWVDTDLREEYDRLYLKRPSTADLDSSSATRTSASEEATSTTTQATRSSRQERNKECAKEKRIIPAGIFGVGKDPRDIAIKSALAHLNPKDKPPKNDRSSRDDQALAKEEVASKDEKSSKSGKSSARHSVVVADEQLKEKQPARDSLEIQETVPETGKL